MVYYNHVCDVCHMLHVFHASLVLKYIIVKRVLLLTDTVIQQCCLSACQLVLSNKNTDMERLLRVTDEGVPYGQIKRLCFLVYFFLFVLTSAVHTCTMYIQVIVCQDPSLRKCGHKWPTVCRTGHKTIYTLSHLLCYFIGFSSLS